MEGGRVYLIDSRGRGWSSNRWVIQQADNRVTANHVGIGGHHRTHTSRHPTSVSSCSMPSMAAQVNALRLAYSRRALGRGCSGSGCPSVHRQLLGHPGCQHRQLGSSVQNGPSFLGHSHGRPIDALNTAQSGVLDIWKRIIGQGEQDGQGRHSRPLPGNIVRPRISRIYNPHHRSPSQHHRSARNPRR